MNPLRAVFAFATCVIACLAASTFHAAAQPVASWNPRAAAGYLDGRLSWWEAWPIAARDHDTACVSCHTVLPYALARPAIRVALQERDASDPERKVLDNVLKRVRMWKDVEPFYPDQLRGLPKSSESRGTEAILNALILANRDAGAGILTDDARHALENMWLLQFQTGDLKGAWAWLNFHNEPWEGEASAYFGASLAALAVGMAPGRYAANIDLQERLKLLREYMQQGVETQPLFNRMVALWASSRLPSLLTRGQQQSIIGAIFAKQQDDGGWNTGMLGPWKRADGTALDTNSDGHATGLAVLALEEAGVAPGDTRLSRGIVWLVEHQDRENGNWRATSVNKQRDPASDRGKFMNDAATAFATMALVKAGVR